jgi:hypothetical protein
MNDEKLIWESYKSIYSESSDVLHEFTEEEFIRKIMEVGELTHEEAMKVFSRYTHDSESHNKTNHHKMLIINPSNGKYIINDYNDYLIEPGYINNVFLSMSMSGWNKPRVVHDEPSPTANAQKHSETVELSDEEAVKYMMKVAKITEKEADAVWMKLLSASHRRVKRNEKTGIYTIDKMVLDPASIHTELGFIPWYEKNDHKIYYHAGRLPITASNVRFSMGALGFHLGSEKLVEYISKGSYKKDSGISNREMEMGKRLTISKFKVKSECGLRYIVDCNEDMPWEDPIQLSVYLYYEGIINKDDAKIFLDHFEVYDTRDEDDIYGFNNDDEDTTYHIALDKIERRGGASSGSGYHPSDDLPMMSQYGKMYKDRDGLEFIRRYLMDEYNYAAIEYINAAEGIHVMDKEGDEELSICILDPCLLEDVKPTKAKIVKKIK